MAISEIGPSLTDVAMVAWSASREASGLHVTAFQSAITRTCGFAVSSRLARQTPTNLAIIAARRPGSDRRPAAACLPHRRNEPVVRNAILSAENDRISPSRQASIATPSASGNDPRGARDVRAAEGGDLGRALTREVVVVPAVQEPQTADRIDREDDRGRASEDRSLLQIDRQLR